MSGFRRFVLFVFSLAGLACAVVPLVVMAPRASDFASMVETLASYRGAELGYLVCVLMTLAWCACNLLRALFSRRHDAISVMEVDGGKITVTRNAVASQASRVVEESGLGTTRDVDVRSSATGTVSVAVKVVPHESIDITREAPTLHDLLVRGLTAMCGECLGTVDVEFLEPEQASSLAADDEDDAYAGDEEPSDAEHDAAVAAAPDDDVPVAGGDITVPIHGGREE